MIVKPSLCFGVDINMINGSNTLFSHCVAYEQSLVDFKFMLQI